MFEKDAKQYHIHCKQGDVGRYVLLPGDPFRTDIIAQHLDDPILVAHNREHKTWTGTLNGEKVSVTSTGMGCPSTAIAVEELISCGADTFIRVGTCGRIADSTKMNGVMGTINSAAVRDEGTTRQYVPIEFPAVADRIVINALTAAAKRLSHVFMEGITVSKDSFYSFVFPDTVPNGETIKARTDIWKSAGAVSSEMECAAIFVISTIRGCRSAGIMAFSDSKTIESDIHHVIQTACEAIKILIEDDKRI